jgi:hypothetical protein
VLFVGPCIPSVLSHSSLPVHVTGA